MIRVVLAQGGVGDVAGDLIKKTGADLTDEYDWAAFLVIVVFTAVLGAFVARILEERKPSWGVSLRVGIPAIPLAIMFAFMGAVFSAPPEWLFLSSLVGSAIAIPLALFVTKRFGLTQVIRVEPDEPVDTSSLSTDTLTRSLTAIVAEVDARAKYTAVAKAQAKARGLARLAAKAKKAKAKE